MGIQNHLGMILGAYKLRRWELEELNLEDDLIDSAPTLFADVYAAHEGS